MRPSLGIGQQLHFVHHVGDSSPRWRVEPPYPGLSGTSIRRPLCSMASITAGRFQRVLGEPLWKTTGRPPRDP